MRHILAALAGVLLLALLVPTSQAGNAFGQTPRRGCCSHHSGVCGCSGARAKCCDGTLSPTCGCD